MCIPVIKLKLHVLNILHTKENAKGVPPVYLALLECFLFVLLGFKSHLTILL